jgi:ribosomal protein S1
MNYERVDDPFDTFEKGERVRVVIKDIDHEKKRVALSRKALLEDPWLEASRTIKEGEIITGKVVRLARFGAFVELRKGVEGLVHISEMGGGKRIWSPHEVVKVGAEVAVKVLSIDDEKRRIGLSMNEAAEAESKEQDADAMASRRDSPSSDKSLGTLGDLFSDVLKK